MVRTTAFQAVNRSPILREATSRFPYHKPPYLRAVLSFQKYGLIAEAFFIYNKKVYNKRN